MSEPLDYERFGRQIALPELGPEGQRALAANAVSFAGGDAATRALAGELYRRAGGRVGDTAACVLSLPGVANSEPERWAMAAWAAVEAARRVIGKEARSYPAALAARFSRASVR